MRVRLFNRGVLGTHFPAYLAIAIGGWLYTSEQPSQAQIAAAEDSQHQADTAAASQASAQGTGTAPGQPLKGKVSALQAAAGIKAIGEGVHRLKRTAQDMIGELQRQDMVVVSEPDAIGPIIMPALPDPSGTISTGGYLPPRKKWLDFYMSEMQNLIPLIFGDLATTDIPDHKQSEVSGLWGQMQSLMDDAQVHFQRLVPLTEGPKFDSDAIGKEALAIFQDAEQLEKLRKQVFHIIKKK